MGRGRDRYVRPETMANNRGQRSAARLKAASAWPLGRELRLGARVFRLSQGFGAVQRERESACP